MNMFQAKDLLLERAIKLADLGVIEKNAACLSVRCDHFMIITPPDLNVETSTSKEMIAVYLKDMVYLGKWVPHIDYVLHAAIYNRRNDINAIIHTTRKSTVTSSSAGLTVPPLLDDMARIAGVSTRIAEYHQPVDGETIRSVLDNLRKRNAVLLSDNGALCCAGSLDDAYAVAQVVDKNCKAFIGGGIRINAVEAWLMRIGYKLKYSRQAQLNR